MANVTAWKPPEFRDTGPTYELRPKPPSRDDLRTLGCREETISYLFPNPKTSAILRNPADWFFIDRAWWKATAGVLDDIYHVAGGCFGELTLEEQTALLGLELTTIQGTRSKLGRGRWMLLSGAPATIEEYALERLLGSGETGASCESKAFFGLYLMVKKRFEIEYGHWLGYDTENRALYTPGSAYADKVLAALGLVLRNPVQEYDQNEHYFGHFLKVPFSAVSAFVETTGRDYLERFLGHSYKHGIMGFSGHPDLTIGDKGNLLRFVEVKNKDRLLGNQVFWIRDFAKPLGLNFKLVRVEERYES
jgi:hypothetical protein